MRLSTRTAALLTTAILTAAPIAAHANDVTKDATLIGSGVGTTYRIDGVSSPTQNALLVSASHGGATTVDLSTTPPGTVQIQNNSTASYTFRSTLFNTSVTVQAGATGVATVKSTSAGACATVTAEIAEGTVVATITVCVA
ncbi:MAG TPA: hypothetical protein VFQ85_08250 [Mycobacteriales bacterium]|jgi:hypothetical protein|nr:hypothetical protein [Mycobacteriales bacterium]